MSELHGTDAPAGPGIDNPSRHDTGWHPRDAAWVTWVALLPILLLILSVLAAAVEGNRWPLIDDVVLTWLFAGFVGLVVFVPAILVSLFGATALKRRFRFGRRLASIGSAAVVLVVAVLAYNIVADTVALAGQHDPSSSELSFSPLAACVVLIPYVAIAALNGYVIVRLWRRAL
ncbi:hypothetical protein ERC79_15795 [Rhodococcus sp. ABRD24]|uniref:hypothetical protein n=1 Tax=Rhodococcus sp. ABRD24 TaxID=2507582 RepID=UPI00103C5646|nr:hypothetical protein [Rhodococcus sp. ABRD24]QBJ97241.1 hypothetical protein ERC79_15795 [Rhodococcus sp. ABRD24]